jgi:hypothetical protein
MQLYVVYCGRCERTFRNRQMFVYLAVTGPGKAFNGDKKQLTSEVEIERMTQTETTTARILTSECILNLSVRESYNSSVTQEIIARTPWKRRNLYENTLRQDFSQWVKNLLMHWHTI